MLTTAAFTSSYMKLETGIRLRYIEHGAPDGDPVLFLHGWSDSWFSFSRVLPLLPASVRAIVPDQRGHGESERPVGEYPMRTLAGDALALLNALEIPRARVVGHCMGGFVALHLAALAPERVSGLVIVASAVDARTDAIRQLREAVESCADPVDQSFIREFQASTIYRTVPEEFFETVVSESGRLPARVWKALYRGFTETEPADTRLIQCPVRILWGDKDTVFSRADQDLLLHRLPGSQLTVLPDIGHAVHWEAPEELARVIS